MRLVGILTSHDICNVTFSVSVWKKGLWKFQVKKYIVVIFLWMVGIEENVFVIVLCVSLKLVLMLKVADRYVQLQQFCLLSSLLLLSATSVHSWCCINLFVPICFVLFVSVKIMTVEYEYPNVIVLWLS